MHQDRHQDRHDADSYQRIEVITGERRRRNWSAAEKARIVAESADRGAAARAGSRLILGPEEIQGNRGA